MRVLLFAGLAEAVGRRELDVPEELGCASVRELEARLRAEQPALAGRPFRVAVNRRYAAGDERLSPGDEVALIPPVSGLSVIALTDRPIDVGAVLSAVEGPGEGGVVLFLGRVRDQARGQAVTRLDYEAYGEMALHELVALADEARAQHGASRVAAVHRTGRLEIGELAVAIAVAAPHRREAFEACAWLIDTLKQRVPIWKKEWYADGSQWIAERP